jgi:8-oxo-dGTP pyrophosphatase MutT (NUDIX family)
MKAYGNTYEARRRELVERDDNATLVSVLIERTRDGVKELLVQTRWKPDQDPVHSGTLEIPAGRLHAYEDIFDAVRREVAEETSLEISEFVGAKRSAPHGDEHDICYAFTPYCCQQQLQGSFPRVGFVFLCAVRDGELKANPAENRDLRWIDKNTLRQMLATSGESFFVLQRGVLELYLAECEVPR